jgi:hypothetical protein
LWRLSSRLSCIRGLRNVVQIDSSCLGCELFYVSFSWKYPLETLQAASLSPYRSMVCPSLIEGYFYETAHPEQSLRVNKPCYHSDWRRILALQIRFLFPSSAAKLTMSVSSTWVHAVEEYELTLSTFAERATLSSGELTWCRLSYDGDDITTDTILFSC